MRQIRNLIWSECLKLGPPFTIGVGDRERPNIRTVWRTMNEGGVDLDATTIQRVMNLDRNARARAGKDYQPSNQLKAGLMVWLEIDDEIDLIRAWRKAPPAPPLRPHLRK